MYRKRMSEALQEARAYRDPVNEDKGFSSQQIKMAYGVLNDPRYKQGNYSGAVRAIEKIARGLSNHPDVANALRRANEELEEALEVKWDSNKQGWFDKQGRRRYLGKMATNKLMSKAIDKAKETGDFINPFKLKHGQRPEETELEEGKYERYSNLLIQKGRMQKANDKQGERLTDIEIEKEKKKLGIRDEYIPEGMVKRVMQTVHDKLSKEGGAAGFDDLAKEVKKEFGITISKDTLKNMPGVKQHRDGDYILENKSSELINLYQIKNKTPEIEARIAKLEKELKVIKREVKEGTMIGGIVTDNSGKKMPGYDKAKKALKDFMSKPQPAKGADNKVMAFIFDDELLDDLYVASKKNVSDVRPMVKKRLKALGIKEDLEENFQNFTKADFAKLEADNEHGEAAEKLVQKFGTREERNIIAVINIRHHKTGYISGPDFRERTRIVNKYYSRLK